MNTNGKKGGVRKPHASSRSSKTSFHSVSAKAESLFREHGVVLTLGAEPTCVPRDPQGAEWSVAATGPTKFAYACTLAKNLTEQVLPGALILFAPGKNYPGEINPRWAIHVVGRRDGLPLASEQISQRSATARDADVFLRRLTKKLRVTATPLILLDPLHPSCSVRVLPLDGDGSKWTSPLWMFPDGTELLRSEGPAGLRLPLHLLKSEGPLRALTVEIRDRRLAVFLPPLLQDPWTALFAAAIASLPGGVACDFFGHLPEDAACLWQSVGIAADPGVLEINLPPCANWEEYDTWLRHLDRAQRKAGLRTWKRRNSGNIEGTGGGHHLLFGGPSLEQNPFFTRPGWLVSLVRFWQHHPSLAYLFTGCYVGPSSQAPRTDESAKSLWDLEMACAWLETLPPGQDHRLPLAETFAHLHSDTSGNTHRSEISFDKFWNIRFPGGSRGLVEFRAIESLPRVEWASAVALLWRTLAARLLAKPFRHALKDFGDTLHDRYFLPSVIWEDFEAVLAELASHGLKPDPGIFRAIWDWRFPLLLETPDGLTVRRALEGWPLLCETPLEGGTTSRFVDTSMERLEFAASDKFANSHVLRINGRALPLLQWRDGVQLAGLRSRRSALYPSLHPGMPVQFPLILEIVGPSRTRAFVLDHAGKQFAVRPAHLPSPELGLPCRRANPSHFSYDLRLAG